MFAAHQWKTDIDDLLARATDVMVSLAPGEVAGATVGAREAARALLGIVYHLQGKHGLAVVQRTCADLARCDEAWQSNMTTFPRELTEDRPLRLVAVVCAGLLKVATRDSVRSALAFWATENDPAIWQSVAA